MQNFITKIFWERLCAIYLVVFWVLQIVRYSLKKYCLICGWGAPTENAHAFPQISSNTFARAICRFAQGGRYGMAKQTRKHSTRNRKKCRSDYVYGALCLPPSKKAPKLHATTQQPEIADFRNGSCPAISDVCFRLVFCSGARQGVIHVKNEHNAYVHHLSRRLEGLFFRRFRAALDSPDVVM